ncbi:hypothetical protein ACLOJK_026730 [Asimina triloba]
MTSCSHGVCQQRRRQQGRQHLDEDSCVKRSSNDEFFTRNAEAALQWWPTMKIPCCEDITGVMTAMVVQMSSVDELIVLCPEMKIPCGEDVARVIQMSGVDERIVAMGFSTRGVEQGCCRSRGSMDVRMSSVDEWIVAMGFSAGEHGHSDERHGLADRWLAEAVRRGSEVASCCSG